MQKTWPQVQSNQLYPLVFQSQSLQIMNQQLLVVLHSAIVHYPIVNCDSNQNYHWLSRNLNFRLNKNTIYFMLYPIPIELTSRIARGWPCCIPLVIIPTWVLIGWALWSLLPSHEIICGVATYTTTNNINQIAFYLSIKILSLKKDLLRDWTSESDIAGPDCPSDNVRNVININLTKLFWSRAFASRALSGSRKFNIFWEYSQQISTEQLIIFCSIIICNWW